LRVKSKVWIVSAITTVILAIWTLSVYYQLTYGTLPSGWGGFALSIALAAFFALLLIASVLSLVITAIYGAGFYKFGLVISIVLAVFALLTIPTVFLAMIPHIAVGIWGVTR